ncbi:MAG TPA: hypothetical protein PKW55_05695 [Spirochaetota bacterium]|mgnify:CR=1 FL=1|nr:hypothetical protein [Spirochaetota bacterium]HOM37555.1 hypothetical protein [Spirochaetota bacterium]HPQ49473.1 hypothetical protein [Spirochaetota bacterium]
MEFFLFLLSILVAAIFYLKLSKKIAGIELELSDELKSEIISLIAEFNQSAERNITLIEEKVNIAKSVASEIANQVVYMEKLKKTLEREIKEAEIKLNNLLINSKSVINSTNTKTIIAKAYEEIKKNIKLVEGKDNQVIKDTLNSNEIKDNTNIKVSEGIKTVKNEDSSEKENANEKNLYIVNMFKNGESIDKISEKVGLSKTEIELILKLENLI